MFDLDQLRATERAVGFQYPSTLWSVAGVLASAFTAAFISCRAAKPDDLVVAYELGLDTSLVPFACEPQPDHTDYYCCETMGGPTVAVFADHTVVAEWPTFADFLAWCHRAATEQKHTSSSSIPPSQMKTKE